MKQTLDLIIITIRIVIAIFIGKGHSNTPIIP